MKTMKTLKTPFSGPQQFMGYAMFHIGSDLSSYTGKEVFLCHLLTDMRLESIHRADFDWRSLEAGRLVVALGPANGERLLCSVCSVEEVEAEEMVVLVPKAVAHRVLSGDMPMAVEGATVEPVRILPRPKDVTIVNRALPVNAKSITLERLPQRLAALMSKGRASSPDGDRLLEAHEDESILHAVTKGLLGVPERLSGRGSRADHVEVSGQSIQADSKAHSLSPQQTEVAGPPPDLSALPPSHPDVRASTRNRGFRLIERRRIKEEDRIKKMQ